MNQAPRAAVLVMASVSVLAGLVALAAVTRARGRKCEALPNALDATVSHNVCGPILERYRAEGGPAGLGLPVSDEQPVAFELARTSGDREMAFRRGMIYLDTATGQTTVALHQLYASSR